MDSIYENSSFLLSAATSEKKHTQYKVNSNEEQERLCQPKWTKVLLIVFAIFFALGGICVLSILYVSVSVKLSAQETNVTIMAKKLEELTANYTRVREYLSFYETFTSQSLSCNMSLTAFNGNLYFFSSNKMNWSSSRAFCISKKADLVTIPSQTEQIFLASKIKQIHWIGLSDLKTEGHWVWVNNQTLKETGVNFWHKRKSEKNEPDNSKKDDPTGENCAVMNNNFSYSMNWQYTRKTTWGKTPLEEMESATAEVKEGKKECLLHWHG
ncbi:hypothetical protein QQF64_013209 [Cirrhinus molitorella]|uniref:C-type lectin domain-containing protein n=1 Tax=Cirrhinus molitorella TaxID=172907 RepID=A0ABR3LQG6_9TELE